MVKEGTWITAVAILFGWAMALVSAVSGALLHVEDFDALEGWVDRDPGEMTVTHNAGNYLQGSFGPTILTQTDAFRADSGSSGGAFTGNYVTLGITQISFDFYALNVLPSDLFIRIISGSEVFSYQFNNPVAVGNWETFTVDLAYSYGWLGSSEANFNTALTGVDYLDIQVSRSGSGAQTYYLDNVQTLDTDIGDPGGPPSSAIPEPGTLSLFVFVAAVIIVLRRHVAQRRAIPG